MSWRPILGLLVVAELSLVPWADAEGKGPSVFEKKIIEYGWDCPSPEFLHKHIETMKKRPFDGVVFHLRGKDRTFLPPDGADAIPDTEGGSRVFNIVPFEEKDFQKEYKLLADIDWGHFTDNFIILFADSKQDWFDDSHWDTILNNVRLVARAGSIARCAGLVFDPETYYGTHPWRYSDSPHKDVKTFSDFEEKVHERGAAFIKAIESEMPNVQLLTFFQISFLKKFCRPMSPEERETGLKDHTYGLLPAFLEGMLEGATGETTIIDGNEPSYHYDSPEDFHAGFHFIENTARYLIGPNLWGPYHRRIRTGQAVYVDEVMGLRQPEHRGPASRMSEEERLLWLEHNFYWALQTTDRYVWCYNEFVNWWDNGEISREEIEGMGMTWPRECIPSPRIEKALLSARDKYLDGSLLGFGLESIMGRVKPNTNPDQ